MTNDDEPLEWDVLDRLSESLGDAFYTLDSQRFVKNYDQFLHAFRSIYTRTAIGYSYKTNYIPRLLSIIKEKGGYAEVVSSMEYELAEKIGVDPKKIILNGPVKDKSTVAKCLAAGGTINLDAAYEVDLVKEIARELPGGRVAVGLRCNFDIDESLDSRFGFDVDSLSFMECIRSLRRSNNIDVVGLHCHFPNRDLPSYQQRIEQILAVADRVFERPPTYINVGGGYFGNMPSELKEHFHVRIPDVEEYAGVIASGMYDKYRALDEAEQPTLFVEPGSALAADVMRFYCRVLDVKEVRGRRIATVVGSRFNIMPQGGHINLPMTVHAKHGVLDGIAVGGGARGEVCDVAGYTCIERDYLYEGYVGRVLPGDFVSFSNVGSYSVVMKPPFILPDVPIIEFRGGSGEWKMVRHGESFGNVFATYVFDGLEDDLRHG